MSVNRSWFIAYSSCKMLKWGSKNLLPHFFVIASSGPNQF
jgi:hypothetical protein